MLRCARCGHDLAAGDVARCPACGEDPRAGGEGDAKAVSAGSVRPAHLAILEGDTSAALAEDARVPPKRLVSSAGPAVPIIKQQNDSVPSGWIARLEAARMVSTNGSGGEVATRSAPPRSPTRPPPLRKKKPREKESKPAHLLVAELEAQEEKRRDEERSRLTEAFHEDPSDEIANVAIELPAEVKKRRIPDWLVVTLLLGALGGGITGVYLMTKKEPAPKAVVDPKLTADLVRRREAVAHLERGHTLALEGKKSADEAIAAYTKALEVEPTLAAAEKGLAIAFASKDDGEKAVAHYKRYLEINPDAKDGPEVRKIIDSYERTQKQDKNGRRRR